MKFDEMGLSKPLLDSLQAMGFSIPTPIQEQAIPILLNGADLIGQAQTGTGKTAAFGLPLLEAWLKAAHARRSGTPSGAAPLPSSNSPAAPPPISAPHGNSPAAHSSMPTPHSHSSAAPAPASHVGRSGAPHHSRVPQSKYSPSIAIPSALVLVPTRELAVQVHQSLQAMAGRTGARVVPVYGGVDMRKQLYFFRHPVDIVVGTPGRTLDHIRQGSLRLNEVRTVVLDEADHMFDMGFIRDVTKILDFTPSKRQTLLFSATMPLEVVRLAQKYMKDPKTIKVSEDNLTVEGIKQLYVRTPPGQRFGMLLAALRTTKPFLALVFCRTKHDAKKIARQLKINGVSADALHGNLRQNAREKAMASFRAGKIDVMVATDLASRGLDVPGITHVINYDLPDDPMTYVHRIGRTARAGSLGTAISLVGGDPRRAVEIIERATGSSIAEMPLKADPSVISVHPDERPGNGPGRHGRRDSGRSREGAGHREGSPHGDRSSGPHESSSSSHRAGRSSIHPSRHGGPRPPPGGHHHSSHRRY